MNNYIKNKLSLKINLLLSQGKKKSGVITETHINSLLKGFSGYGIYEIIYDNMNLFPISISRISDNYKIVKKDKYILLDNGLSNNIMLYHNQFIDFNLDEYRNSVLKKMLKD